MAGRPGPKREHEHDEHSAAFVLGGATHAQVGGKPLDARAGQLVLIAAGVVHECRPIDAAAWSYTLFLISPGVSRALDEALAAAARGSVVLEPRGAALALIARKGLEAPAPEIVAAIEEALRISPLPGEDEAVSEGPEAGRSPPRSLAAIEERLRRPDDRAPSLDEMSRMAGMDKFELVRSFKTCYGLAPHAYLLNARINRAKDLLRSGASPAEAAAECGFWDQSHFSRVFATRVGLCPAEYARMYKTRARRGG